MKNQTLYINPDTLDLEFDESGFLRMITDHETTAQNIRNTLLAEKGSFPLVPAHGVELMRVLGQKTGAETDAITDEVMREAILQETDVAYIESLTVSTSQREMTVAFEAVASDGETIEMEVGVSG